MNSYDLVREFHQTYNCPIGSEPTAQTEELQRLRIRLIAEELVEYAEACGMELTIRDSTIDIYKLPVVISGPPNVVEMADALGDLDYVVQGAHIVHGFPSFAIVKEIHRANMSKLGTDGKPLYRGDGKVLKGPNYKAPDIASVLHQFGWKG